MTVEPATDTPAEALAPSAPAPSGTHARDRASISFARTDLGNAERLIMRHGDDLRYCHPWDVWLVWQSRRWGMDKTAEVSQRAKDTVRAIYAEIAGLEDADDRKWLAKHATKSEGATRIREMMALAKSEPGIPVLPESLDAAAMTLNFSNGSIEIDPFSESEK